MAFFRVSLSGLSLFKRDIAFGIFVGEFDCFLRGLKLFVAQFFKASFSFLMKSTQSYFNLSVSMKAKNLLLNEKGKEITKKPTKRATKISAEQLIRKFFRNSIKNRLEQFLKESPAIVRAIALASTPNAIYNPLGPDIVLYQFLTYCLIYSKSQMCPSMIDLLGYLGDKQACAIVKHRAIGKPTTQLMMMWGLRKHRIDMAENERSIGSLFFDFLVTQSYTNVWLRIRQLSVLNDQYLCTIVCCSFSAFYASWSLNLFILAWFTQISAFSATLSAISVRATRTPNIGVAIKYQSMIDCIVSYLIFSQNIIINNKIIFSFYTHPHVDSPEHPFLVIPILSPYYIFRYYFVWMAILTFIILFSSIIIQMKAEQNLDTISDEELSKLEKKYIKGCGKIYHQPGVMTAKGDALYDFTCNFSHRCPQCESSYRRYYNVVCMRNQEKLRIANKKETDSKLEAYRMKYFEPKPGCSCKDHEMCKECFAFLQSEVTRFEKGCGATWEEEFGGMAAGPATVTCFDNYFLCESCAKPLAFIKSLNKQYPHVKLEHIPEQQKMFWAPKSYPYYSGHL